MAQPFGFIWLLNHLPSVSTRYITIQNSGFELDAYQYGTNSYQYTGSAPLHWERYDLNDVMTAYGDGLANPSGGSSFNDPLFNDGAPEGTLVEYIGDENIVDAEFGISQSLTDNLVTRDTTYVLRAWVGYSLPNKWKDSSDGKDVQLGKMDSFPGYRVQLLAHDAILAEDNNTLSITQGQWKESHVSVTVLLGNPHIGDTLGVRLVHKQHKEKFSVWFDDIRLEAIAVTSSPSLSPSGNPSVSPTLMPSDSSSPSLSPSFTPSDHPTRMPSAAPPLPPSYAPSDHLTTTNQPTIRSTSMSTTYPTRVPITFAPSKALIASTHIRTSSQIHTSVSDLEQMQKKETEFEWLTLILCAISGVSCIGIVMVIRWWLIEREKRSKAEHDINVSNVTQQNSEMIQTELHNQIIQMDIQPTEANITSNVCTETAEGARNEVHNMIIQTPLMIVGEPVHEIEESESNSSSDGLWEQNCKITIK